MILCTVLDPRISYEGMKADYEDDISLLSYLESAKNDLHRHYLDNYALASPESESATPYSALPLTRGNSPQKVDFTSRYRRKARTTVDELEDYFKLSPEDFATCDPIQWWLGRRAQFPNLFRLARDILSIPGMLQRFIFIS